MQEKSNTGHSSDRTTPSSSVSSLGGESPYTSGRAPRPTKPRGTDSDTESEPGVVMPGSPELTRNGVSGKENDDPALKEVMNQINSSFPSEKKSE